MSHSSKYGTFLQKWHIPQKMAHSSKNGTLLQKGWGTLCIKEHFTSRNTLLLKSWTHFAAQHTLQSHNLLPSTLCIVTFCSDEQFPSNWLVTVCFLTHFASQELNTLCSPIHFAKSQFTPQHPLHCYLLLKRTVCFKLACYSLLLNTLYPAAHFAYWNDFLLGTLCFQTLFAS